MTIKIKDNIFAYAIISYLGLWAVSFIIECATVAKMIKINNANGLVSEALFNVYFAFKYVNYIFTAIAIIVTVIVAVRYLVVYFKSNSYIDK